MNYWLMKSEPSVYSIDDLSANTNQTDYWDGIRNYQARNMLRDDMQVGDHAFFYHSNCKTPGIIGVMKIVKSGYPDSTAFDPKHTYYDAKSKPDNPRWYRVDVKLVRKFKRIISLEELKQQQKLANMILLRKGNRLSIMPVNKTEWDCILQLEKQA